MQMWVLCGVAALVRTDVRYQVSPEGPVGQGGHFDEGFLKVEGCGDADSGGFLKNHGDKLDRYAVERDFLQAAAHPQSPWRGKVPRLFRERPMPTESGAPGRLSMELENLLCDEGFAPMAQPMLLDLKLGTQTWLETQSKAKIDDMHSKDAAYTTKLLGFRVTSAALLRGGGVVEAGRGADKQGLPDGEAWRAGRVRAEAPHGEDAERIVAMYFQDDPALLQRFGSVVRELVELFEQQSEHRFVGMSLFAVYDNAAAEKEKTLKVRLIDFAHVTPLADLVYHGVTLGDLMHSAAACPHTHGGRESVHCGLDRLHAPLEVLDFRGDTVVLPAGTPIDRRSVRLERPAPASGGSQEPYYPFAFGGHAEHADPTKPCSFAPLVDVGVLFGLGHLERLVAERLAEVGAEKRKAEGQLDQAEKRFKPEK